MLPASQSSILSNNRALVRLSELPWVTQLTVAEQWLGYKSSVLAKRHMVRNVNLCYGGLNLAKTEGTFLHTSVFRSAFHTPSNGLCDKISWGNIRDPIFRVSQA